MLKRYVEETITLWLMISHFYEELSMLFVGMW